MRKLAVVVLALALCGCAGGVAQTRPASSGPDLTPVRFGVIGDQTGTYDLDAAYVVLGQGVAALNAANVELVVHTGDLIESAKPEAEVRADWARARALLDGLEAPWLLAPGDHDVNPPERVSGSDDRSREALFMALYGTHAADARTALWQRRDHRGVRFIALNSHDTFHADPRWGNTFLAAISPAQLAWLEIALAAEPAPRATVVFVHQPLWYNWAAWAPVHEVLRQHGVDLVIGGHFHYPQDEGSLDGIHYMVVGATGGMTKTGSASSGARHHVSVVEIGAEGHTVRLVPLTGDPALTSAPPRRDMDRVQAVSSMLWTSQPPGDIAAGAGPCVALATLGNPIDVPLRVSILDPSGQPVPGQFAADLCPAAAQECRIAPNARIRSSNVSSVALREAPAPAWVSQGPESDLTVRVTFDGQAGPYSLDQPAAVTGVPCIAGSP